MRILFIATASALFFAAVITELFMRLWPGQYFALLVLSFIVLLLSGLLNARLAGWLGTPAASRGRDRGRPEHARSPHPRQQARQPARDRAQADVWADKQANVGTRTQATQGNGPSADSARESGTVKWFNRTKGFGFVIRESGEEIFVHQRSIRATGEGENRRRPALRDGQSVTFVVAEREKGLQAEDVVPAD